MLCWQHLGALNSLLVLCSAFGALMHTLMVSAHSPMGLMFVLALQSVCHLVQPAVLLDVPGTCVT